MSPEPWILLCMLSLIDLKAAAPGLLTCRAELCAVQDSIWKIAPEKTNERAVVFLTDFQTFLGVLTHQHSQL